MYNPLAIRSFVLLLASCLGLLACAATPPKHSPSPSPVAKQVKEAREALFRTAGHLKGRIRKGPETTEFELVANPPNVEITFSGQQERFRIPVEGSSGIQEYHEGRWILSQKFTNESAIGGTLISFEDMAFRIWFWPMPKELGTETIRSKVCTIIRFTPPRNQSAYSFVDVALDRDSLLPMRLICYGAEDIEVKRFEPVKVQKVGDDWMVQSVRVTVPRARGAYSSPTYIELDPVVNSSVKRPARN